MSRCVSPWECQCNDVDMMEPLKCGPCKRCVKRALDMKSSLLMGGLNMNEEESCLSSRVGEYMDLENERSSSVNCESQVETVTQSMGPNNNGQRDESGVELNVVTDLSETGSYSFSRNSPHDMVNLRTGIDTVENKESVPNGRYPEHGKIGTERCLIEVDGARAVETRSMVKQGEEQKSNSPGGSTGQSTEALPLLPEKVILSSFSDEDLVRCQQKDSDIAFVYSNLMVGYKKPSSARAVTKSPAARHYWVIWNSLSMINGLVFKECLQKNGLSKYYQLLVPRTLKNTVLKEVHDAKMGGTLGVAKHMRR